MPLLVCRLLSSLRTTTRSPMGSMMSYSAARLGVGRLAMALILCEPSLGRLCLGRGERHIVRVLVAKVFERGRAETILELFEVQAHRSHRHARRFNGAAGKIRIGGRERPRRAGELANAADDPVDRPRRV